ncbi:uncharacterized protein ASCRUDRAFT_71043 [Ascoidea rubescens DSM 1968]|uniref:Uncharacterized protein n=1 Tax=Ascoidea rubescens DSM 1968 TaxID=1344418 RepID=A0A1D2VG07_9ASCO|nr:hypothetical protein ASCRUDRAFT_71043 [Ascoidea rubescens DSM 1968]ODV60565.1 hypothetical protein ASCRUDRAFT_71043 [Ascoidea rubescens DSM 1968]
MYCQMLKAQVLRRGQSSILLSRNYRYFSTTIVRSNLLKNKSKNRKPPTIFEELKKKVLDDSTEKKVDLTIDQIKAKTQEEWNNLSEETKKTMQNAYDEGVKAYESGLNSLKSVSKPKSVMDQIKDDISETANKAHETFSDEDLALKAKEKWEGLTEDAQAKLESTYQENLETYEDSLKDAGSTAKETAEDAGSTLKHLKEDFIDKPAEQIISKTKEEWNNISSEVGDIVDTGKSILYGQNKDQKEHDVVDTGKTILYGKDKDQQKHNNDNNKTERKNSRKDLNNLLKNEQRKEGNKYGKT